MRFNFIFLLFISFLFLGCGGGSGATNTTIGNDVTPSIVTESLTISGVAIMENGNAYEINTPVFAVDTNGNAAKGKVIDNAGNYVITLTSDISTSKKSKGLGGDIILRVGASNLGNILTIILPEQKSKTQIVINLNAIVAEASKKYLENIDIAVLFEKVEDAIRKTLEGNVAILETTDQEILATQIVKVTREELIVTIKEVTDVLFGANVVSADFLSGAITVKEVAILKDVINNSLKIKYNINTSSDSNGNITSSFQAGHGATVTITLTPNDGYEIDKVIVDRVSVPATTIITFTNVLGNHTITVTHKLKAYSIKTSAGLNGNISPSLNVKHGEDATVNITPNANYEIDVLKIDGVKSAANSIVIFTKVKANHTVDVTFKLKAYLITTSAGANGSITVSQTVNHGSNATITITPNANYDIDVLTVDGVTVTTTSSYVFTNVTAVHTISVTFKLKTYVITTSAGPNGSVSSSITVNFGSSTTVTISPNPGFSVDVLTVDGVVLSSSLSYTFSNVTSNHTINVTFIQSYLITTSTDAKGSITASHIVNHGSNTTITMTPSLGYEVDVLTVDGLTIASALSYTFSNVTAAHTISVTYKIKTFTITTTSSANGSISASTTINYGDSVIVTMTPDTDYEIGTLTVDGSSVTVVPTYSFTNVTSSHIIAVTFTLKHTIFASAGAHGSISPSGSVHVLPGGSKSFTIIPETGYLIDVLKVDGVEIPTQYQYNFSSVNAGHTINVTFKVSNFMSIGNCLGQNYGIIAITAGLALKSNGSVLKWGGQSTIPSEASSDVIAMAVGSAHNLVLKSDGSVFGWGDNAYGQTTIPLSATSGVKAIAAGYLYSVALKSDGSVLAWGYNGLGQTTIPDSATSDVIAISASWSHTLALKSDGSVLAWGGNNWYGETTIPASATSDVIAIAAGHNHSVALKRDGSVIAWGVNDEGITTIPSGATSDVIAIAAGESHTVALKSDGSVLAWGSNYYGQTIVPPSATSDVIAISISGSQTVALKSDGSIIEWGAKGSNEPSGDTSGVVEISSSWFHTVALKSNGSVLAWGENTFGKTAVPSNASSGVTAIAAGVHHTVALKSDGSVIAWGADYSGQSTIPLSATSDVIAIAAGSDFTVALKSNGSVLVWGSNSFNLQTIPSGATSGVIAITTGRYHIVALKSDGSVLAWGYNASGQTTIPSGASTGVIAIAAGENHTVALKSDGSVLAWGHDGYGQTTIPSGATSNVIAIAAGRDHTVALKSDGSVLAWGYNTYGQIDIPSDLPPVAKLFAGGDTTTFIFRE